MSEKTAAALVVVESPAKAKTIHKYLGPGYRVEASKGHVKDLPKSKLGIDEAGGFEPTYVVLKDRGRVLEHLKKEARHASAIFLAADPDREGEAICWHLAEELGGDGKPVHRVLLNEITRRGVEDAFAHPVSIDRNMVNAQQARRILDRLVGYKISPILWHKVRRGLSAGRVQSVALRMIVERQREIDTFVRVEYWTVDADLEAEAPPPFTARLVKEDGKKAEPKSQADADRIQAALQGASWRVGKVERKERRKSSAPPYITSKLQQDAARKLGFTVKKTMLLAQHLYEGKDIGEAGTVGLITYMRTDSTRVSGQALQEVRAYIQGTYGAEYLPAEARHFRTGKDAQDAHEAIRPTSLDLTPERVKKYLGRDEWALYRLIWNRFVASQMNPAVFDETIAEILAAGFTFRAKGSVMKFAGFLAAYRGEKAAETEPENGKERNGKERNGEEKTGEEKTGEEKTGEEGVELPEGVLPPLAEGQVVRLLKLRPEQHFTEPPPPFSEASLVKALEENGIGRPSTYAAIIAVIQKREYVTKEKGRFAPTEVGFIVCDLLTTSFGDIVDVGYTAKLEEILDEIEQGRKDWVEALREFHGKFQRDLERAKVEMRDVKRETEETDEVCEKCNRGMVIKFGRYGRFLACSGYPECKSTRELRANGNGNGKTGTAEAAPEFDEKCPKCGKPMVVRRGRWGQFLACTDYPACKGTRKILVTAEGKFQTVAADRPLEEKCPECGKHLVEKSGRFGRFVACSGYPDCRWIKRNETGVVCPQGCGGAIVEKRSRRGKVFFGCTGYPKCDFTLWDRPLPEKCPACGHGWLVVKTTKREGTVARCGRKECDFRRPLAP